MLTKFTLVLGGCASGKSYFSEKLILSSSLSRIYIATAQAFDAEMDAKILRHQKMRGPHWRTCEAPFDIPSALKGVKTGEIVLIDCATMWLTNHILAEHDIDAQTDALILAIHACPAPVVIVSNEVGAGIVPENALARRFRNAQGRLNQQLAAEAACVIGVMAGLPFALKGALPDGVTP
ncbi:Bifunctional adenosylcobalamin biosynthesis protein CobP [Aquimixticola soesokkakensis]|uniref:Bifunctional adenosylcobalamin biosynthesis protein n=1 Tax=Aquimixticola soesokkakensis TaxID=1519096 RepID=A0A1Y5T3C1_9RHOB|nr:Bifunctional adenosylcobalamin biosynthesis protein CobP [Aquimixticola soesokkakensis]